MARHFLDDAGAYALVDPTALRERIAGLPDQIEEAWSAAEALELPHHYASAERVVVLGMGGSGIGGALLQALAVDVGAKTPVTVVRGYSLPAWVDHGALVIASSHSGNTEETVAAFAQALDSGARCVAISSGGRILEQAASLGVPHLRVRWSGEPRAALGWSFVSLLAIGGRLGLIPDLGSDVRDAAAAVRAYATALGVDTPEASNAAKQLARRCDGRLVVTIGSGALAPAAYRWRTQINENGKSWAVADELPEMNHNAPLGYAAPAALVPLLHVVLLRHAAMHARVRLRVEATLDDLRRHDVSAEIVDVPGGNVLAQQICAVHLGDWVSYYMGVLRGVDPSSMEALERLKELLASKK